jgi:excisionase family DNA binding protein
MIFANFPSLHEGAVRVTSTCELNFTDGGERMARKSSRNKVDAAPVIAVPAVEGLLTRDEVAAILRVRRETLSRWLAQGRGPRAIVDDRLIRYRRADVERYIAGEREPT